ncbi:hypothetical protein BHM03_00010265 [Ensete ventricosum]|nr:hypothetical protein BHM03_00010265 [Ensete ventricosum]
MIAWDRRIVKHHCPDTTTPDGEIQDNAGLSDHNAPIIPYKDHPKLRIRKGSNKTLEFLKFRGVDPSFRKIPNPFAPFSAPLPSQSLFKGHPYASWVASLACGHRPYRQLTRGQLPPVGGRLSRVPGRKRLPL